MFVFRTIACYQRKRVFKFVIVLLLFALMGICSQVSHVETVQAWSSSSAIAQTNCPATPIVTGQIVDGNLSTSDCVLKDARERFVDFYSFDVQAGQQINASLNPTFGPSLFLLDGNGVVLREREPFSSSPSKIRLVYQAQRTGKMLLRVTSTTNRTTGPYNLTFSISNCDGDLLQPGQTVSGSISATDCVYKVTEVGADDEATFGDVFTFNAVIGQQVVVNHSATYGPELEIQDSNGVIVADASNTFSSPNECRLVYTPTRSGLNYIVAFPENRETTGNYTLNFAVPACQPMPISVGRTISGTLATSDCVIEGDVTRFTDRFSLAAIAGQELNLTLTAPSLRPRLTVKSSNGVVLTTKDFSPAQIRFTPTQSDSLIIEVTSVFKDETGSYSLVVSGGPDFSISTSPTQITTTTKGKGTITVLISRTGGFTGSVIVTPPVGSNPKIKFTPPNSVSTTGTSVVFSFKNKKVPPGTYQLTFLADDSSGRRKVTTLPMVVQ